MSKVGTWSTAAGNNNATPPDGFPEGQAPSTLNDAAREVMAAVRTMAQDMEWFDHGFSPTYINANSFSITGDQTGRIVAGRRLKMYDGASTIYRSVGTASYTTVTTISLGAGTAITTSLSSFALAIVSPTNTSLPDNMRLSVSALEVTSTLSVGGAVIFGTTLSVSGQASFAAGITIGTTLTATGQSTFGAGISVSATANVGVLQARNGSLTCVAAAGFICTGDITANSDERLKKNWKPLHTSFIAQLATLKMGTFERIDTGVIQAGVSAQGLREFLPEVVHGDEVLSVAYGNAALVACVELAKEVLHLRKEIKALKGK